MKKIVTFGEVMIRFSPPGLNKVVQSLPGSIEATYGGAEANAAVQIAMLGGNVDFVSSLPVGSVGDSCVNYLKGLGVNIDSVIRSELGCMGAYYLETGANQRPSVVEYHRAGSTFSLLPKNHYNWESFLADAEWLLISGVTPAISKIASEAVIGAIETAKHIGVKVCFDLNYRMKLWRWDPNYTPIQLASKILAQCIQKSDLVIGNEQVFSSVLGISTKASSEDLTEKSTDLAKEIIKSFPNLSYVALNMREILSATHNRFGLTLYIKEQDVSFLAPSNKSGYIPYEIGNIVDRVGAGDALAGALLYGMCNLDTFDHQEVTEFAAAAGCLSHSIVGDFSFINRKEIENLLTGNSLGGVVR
tara:strand:- start:294 stop:1373 length:1080 start_codon:yes stop_codon:yes gene_type:complete